MRRLLLKKGGAFAEQPPFKTTGTAGTQDKKMIIIFAVNFKKLVVLGRNIHGPRFLTAGQFQTTVLFLTHG
jgi:hypothetical protein